MTGFLTTLKIKDKNISFKELKVKDYKIILKCLLSEPIDQDNFLLNLNNILLKITSLNETDILEFNILEYLLLLVNIRQISIGSVIFATYKNQKETLNIEINLQKTFDEINKCLTEVTPLLYKEKDITLTFDIPLVKDVLNKKSNLFCKEEIDSLPVRFLSIIKKNSFLIQQKIQKYFFFKAPVEKYSVKLSVNLDDYFQFIKIIFNENMLTLYNNIFYLNKICHMSAEYLESCTYGEFKIFVKKVQEMYDQQTNKLPKNVDENIEDSYDPVDIDSLYGNTNTPSQISRSEFTP
jgi:hypothetical protein